MTEEDRAASGPTRSCRGLGCRCALEASDSGEGVCLRDLSWHLMMHRGLEGLLEQIPGSDGAQVGSHQGLR